eukprot:TRINITY_DN9993_c2_g1_i1.p1 TRINITY_DN9993_c2_g1~~TRINITY_DN9993_c2_g1_i1.p1  ORF type:complete len:238 (+),score=51.18 TRINITY_DN9993_c2_g1_i1:39-752(+)
MAAPPQLITPGSPAIRRDASHVYDQRVTDVPSAFPFDIQLPAQLGCGYNAIDGTIKHPLFKSISAQFFEGRGKSETTSYYTSVADYQKDINDQMGIQPNSVGIHSAGGTKDRIFHPRLIQPPLFDGHHYGVRQFIEEDFRLKLIDGRDGSLVCNPSCKVDAPDDDSHPAIEINFREGKDIKMLERMPFNSESRALYYELIDALGTHYIRETHHGKKAEFVWNIHNLKNLPDKKKRIF